MAWTICENQVLQTVRCWCGAVFAADENSVRMFNENGTTLWCPTTGHAVVRKKSDAQLLREQLDRANASLTAQRDRNDALRREVEHQEKRVTTYRGHLTRIKNRVRAGVCIHCNRTFENLARHMKCKHGEKGVGE